MYCLSIFLFQKIQPFGKEKKLASLGTWVWALKPMHLGFSFIGILKKNCKKIKMKEYNN